MNKKNDTSSRQPLKIAYVPSSLMLCDFITEKQKLMGVKSRTDVLDVLLTRLMNEAKARE